MIDLKKLEQEATKDFDPRKILAYSNAARTARNGKHICSAAMAALVALPEMIAENQSQYEMIGRLTFELEKRKEATCQKT